MTPVAELPKSSENSVPTQRAERRRPARLGILVNSATMTPVAELQTNAASKALDSRELPATPQSLVVPKTAWPHIVQLAKPALATKIVLPSLPTLFSISAAAEIH